MVDPRGSCLPLDGALRRLVPSRSSATTANRMQSARSSSMIVSCPGTEGFAVSSELLPLSGVSCLLCRALQHPRFYAAELRSASELALQ